MTIAPRRFPPPWDIEEHNRSCFIVRDNNGQALAYVYFESEAGRRTAANLLTRDEARRIDHRGDSMDVQLNFPMGAISQPPAADCRRG